MSMTTDKAIEILETTLYGSPEDIEKYGAYEHAQATKEAIKALKALKSGEDKKQNDK